MAKAGARRPDRAEQPEPVALQLHGRCLQAIDCGCGIVVACDFCWSVVFVGATP